MDVTGNHAKTRIFTADLGKSSLSKDLYHAPSRLFLTWSLLVSEMFQNALSDIIFWIFLVTRLKSAAWVFIVAKQILYFDPDS